MNTKEFMFTYSYGDPSQLFTVQRETIPGTAFMSFFVSGQQGMSLGEIHGLRIRMGYGQNEFQSHEIYNTQINLSGQNKPNYVRHIVGATIAELITRGVVDMWFSATLLSEGAIRMYQEFLGNNPNLTVTRKHPDKFTVVKRT